MSEHQQLSAEVIRRVNHPLHRLLSLNVPNWATATVGHMRKSFEIPTAVNDVTMFIAIESNDITTLDDPEEQEAALRRALGMAQQTRRNLADA